MTEEREDLPEGWGVHIVEGLNKRLACMLVFVTVIVIVVIGGCLSKWKQQSVNWEQPLLSAIAIAVSFLTSAYIWQLNP